MTKRQSNQSAFTRSLFDSELPEVWHLVPVGHALLGTQYGLSEPGDTAGTTPIVGMRDINNGSVNLTDLATVENGGADWTEMRLRQGDILLNRTNSPDLVGKVGIVREDSDAVFASYLVRLKVDREKADPEFVNFWLNTVIAQTALKRLSTRGVSQANINPKEFRKHCPLPLPPLSEQRKISEILRTWDESIELASQVIELRQAQYLGLRDQLISWSSGPRKLLRSMVEPVSRPVPRPTKSYRALSIRSHGKGTFIRRVADPTIVGMDTLYVAQEGDIIVNITFAWEGAIALVPQEHGGCLVSHRFPTFVPISRRASARYLRHALRMPRFVYLLGLVSPGGAGRNRVLNKGDFLELEVPAPELSMQALIASALDTAENAIAKASEYRASLTRQKRGLMQKLLTGEWRVKVEAD
jgi:type I restriction enzyme S subunit